MTEELYEALAPLLAASGFDLVDLEQSPGQLRAFVDRPGGVDLDALAEASRLLSGALDDLDPIEGRYTLEVSSPGLERRLRRPEHFTRAVGEMVSLRTRAAAGEVRRLTGRLVAADAEGFELEDAESGGAARRFGYAEVERVRTVFTWGADKRPPRGKQAKTGGARDVGAQTERVTTP